LELVISNLEQMMLVLCSSKYFNCTAEDHFCGSFSKQFFSAFAKSGSSNNSFSLGHSVGLYSGFQRWFSSKNCSMIPDETSVLLLYIER
jgi:hypothetical protein